MGPTVSQGVFVTRALNPLTADEITHASRIIRGQAAAGFARGLRCRRWVE